MAELQPVFIDFEGIDGSGKTTLSNRLAEYLKAQGIPVHHARDQGVFRSKVSRAIREMTRDPSLLGMTDVTEFLLYVARDAQMIDEYIRPKLKPGQVVFSDRYLYSALTQSHHARGLDRKVVGQVLEMAAGGIWPDLVVYCDVDPLTSRVRKKIQKIRERRLGDFGRKGLMGIGFREQMRKGFLELAAENPQTWLVIDNARSTIEESLQLIFNRVRDVLQRKGFPQIPDPKWADLAEVSRGRQTVDPFRQSVDHLLSIDDREQRRERSIQVFLEQIRRLAPSRPAYAALFIAGLDILEAHEVREELLDREPAMIAHGLRGCDSEPSMNFRVRLMEREPVYVAVSLSGMALHPRAIELRQSMASLAPQQVALSLRGNDTEPAWKLREELRKAAPEEVLISVQGIDTPAAWALREKRMEKRSYAPALLVSLGGIDTDRAWAIREELQEEFLPWVLMSLRGLASPKAWEWRSRFVLSAPKIVVKTLGRSEDPRSWEIRDRAKLFAKEVLDSISGIDSGKAWQLRTSLIEKWPNTCVSSLGAGNQSERAWKFRWDQLERNPDNLLLLKHIAKAAVRAQEAPGEEFLDDFDDEDLT